MKSIMIVDDDTNVIDGLSRHVSWEKLNLRVTDSARNGEEALLKIRSCPPDIVITDIYMPKMNGLELIRTIREEFPAVYIIVHSGYDDFDNARRAMRFGVQHFFLKPAAVSDIETVMSEILRDIEVEEKQKKLLSRYNEHMKEHLAYVKDAFIKEMLTTRYRRSNIPTEKLAMLQLSQHTNVIVATVNLIRPPYLTKSKERDWQLLKFGSGNIIKELAADKGVTRQADIHVVDYSDSTFVLVFFAKLQGEDLTAISQQFTKAILDNILLYLRLSLSAGIGGEKAGIHRIIDSYLESQRALEAADYQEINKVFTFEEVYGKEQAVRYAYPLDLLKELHDAIHRKEYEQIGEIWGKFEQDLLKDQNIPLFITQNICISTLSALMIEHVPDHQLKEDSQTMSEIVSQIYSQPTTKELSLWMRQKLQDSFRQAKEELTGKRSHMLIRKVKEHVQNCYDQEIILADIADELFVNRSYLSQLFKRVTGETFVTYLNKYRIERAKEKLQGKHNLIYEVSELVGYQNPTYFSQVFKSITGVSPSEYYKLTE
ncbi:response regulator [Paenibacillus sepulcri]|uniref:Response regulator n=1 Tax=Paenibacillus sepulcri TaxID=359917 RepID=A0ABS7C9E9_9BACL|nr:response regulator [Paenibacillus sepulcri]